jgi:hypothetical protein
VALLDENGLARNTGDIEADIEAALTVWDAGTEINEIPGIGGNQAPRQVGSTGAADPIDLIRPYIDATNDLAGEGLNGFLDVEIVNGGTPGDFTVTVTNNSGGSAYGVAGRLSPILYVVHDDTAALFEQAAGASLGLEELAEDGDPTSLFSEVEALGAAVSDFAIVDTPDGGVQGALSDGETYSFDITASADFPLLSFAGMVAPSNDTFAAFGPGGVSLFNGVTPLTDEELATAVAGALAAWDAGTEANQAGGRGRDMVPFQAAPGDGLAEGTGIVRNAETDPVWTYPEAARLISVTVSPVR